MHAYGYIFAVLISFVLGVSLGREADADKTVVAPLPANFYSEENIAKKYCTDKWGNTIQAVTIRSGKTTITKQVDIYLKGVII